MHSKRVLLDGWSYLMLGGTTVPITLGIGFLAMNRPELSQELSFLLAVYAVVMIPGVYVAAKTGGTQRTPLEAVTGEETSLGIDVPGIEWIAEVRQAPSVPVTMPRGQGQRRLRPGVHARQQVYREGRREAIAPNLRGGGQGLECIGRR